MVISTTDKEILSNYKECLEQQVWTANQVYNLLDQMVTYGYITIVSKAYKIFMPVSILYLYMNILFYLIFLMQFDCRKVSSIYFLTFS